jgi:hypothetical protein
MPKSHIDLHNETLANDWESVALRRVAGRVEALGAEADAMRRNQSETDDPDAAADDFGWEESVLQNLRRRLFDT